MKKIPNKAADVISILWSRSEYSGTENSKGSNFNVIVAAFSVLLFLSGFWRFEGDFLQAHVEYPFPIDILIDFNRMIVGATLAIYFIHAIYFSRKSILIPLGAIGVLLLFHSFLSVKLLFNGNPDWSKNILGSVVLIGLYSVIYSFLRSSNFLIRLDSVVVATVIAWVTTIAYMFVTAGEESILWDGRYFFFSGHQNHAGALWGFASTYLFSMLFRNQATNKAVVFTLLSVSLVLLFATGSRGALIATAFGLLASCYFASASNVRRMIFSVPVIVTIVAAVYVLFGGDITEYFFGLADRGNTRQYTYAWAIEDFIDNPWFGVNVPEGRTVTVENTMLAFMQLGGGFGLLCGSAFYLVFLAKTIISLVRTASYDIKIQFFPLLVVAAVNSMFEAFPLSFLSAGSFAILLPLAYGNIPPERD